VNHAATILGALDRNLRSPVELSLFGRAALSLGFENPPDEFGQSLGDEDLFLSKLMRFDPQDLADARFIADRAGWTPAQIGAILREARVPDIPEVREQFELCSREFS